jgi:hypothetical protein
MGVTGDEPVGADTEDLTNLIASYTAGNIQGDITGVPMVEEGRQGEEITAPEGGEIIEEPTTTDYGW